MFNLISLQLLRGLRPFDIRTIHIATVTRHGLVAVLLNQKRGREDTFSGRIISPREKETPSANAEGLLRSVEVSHSHIWGSSGERLTYRQRAFSIDCFMGSAASLFTITPADVGTPVVLL